MKLWAYMAGSLSATFPARASEWALALVLLNSAAVLTLNDTLFLDSASSYRALAAIATQDTWALLCLLAGLLRFVMLAVNGMWRRSPHLRALGAFMSCFFWFLISYGFFHTGTIALVTAVFPVLLLLDSYNVVRALGEGAVSDAIHQNKKQHGGLGRAPSLV